jgi:hypothetical protein
MQRVFARLLAVFSSLGLSCVLLILLALLTWLGTLEQQHSGLFDVQRKYFESLFLVHRAGSLPIPLPGAALVLGVLFVNLLVGGMLRLRRGVATAGVFVTHIGIALLIVAGLIKLRFSDDGHVTLYEGQASNTFQSYHHWEVAVLEKLEDGKWRETVAPEESFTWATGDKAARIKCAQWPFELELRHFQPNCNVLPKGPMVRSELPTVDGYVLMKQPVEKENEANIAGLYAAVVDTKGGARREAILWGLIRAPLTLEREGRTFGIELRRRQFVMPFTVKLDDFRKEDHPGMSMAKSFSSDVTVVEDGSSRNVRIEMNEPLRSHGLVLYQASWGPSNARPGDALFSTLAVVRNPADQHPLIACIVIALGMLLHFGRKLIRHIRIEAQKA